MEGMLPQTSLMALQDLLSPPDEENEESDDEKVLCNKLIEELNNVHNFIAKNFECIDDTGKHSKY